MMKQIYHKLYKKEEGAALIWTLILFVIVVTLTFSVIFVARQDAIETQMQEQRVKAYYLSLSGIEIGYAALMSDTSPSTKYIDSFTPTKTAVSHTRNIDQGGVTVGSVSVTIGNVTVDGQRWIQIKSVGTLQGTTTSVTSALRIDPTNHENIIREEFGF